MVYPREPRERAITKPLSHLNRTFGLGGSRNVAPQLGDVVHPVVDVFGSSLLKDGAAWFTVDGPVDSTVLEFVKDADKLDRVFRFLAVGFWTDDPATRIFNLFLKEETSGVLIPAIDSLSMDANSRGSARDLILPPGDWRLRLTVSTLTAGDRISLAALYVHHAIGEYLCA